MNPIGTCALCLTPNVTLINSHIVSKWAYRRVIAFDPSGGNALVEVADGRAALSSKQVTENLLCRDCEDIFGVRESYVAKSGLQPNSSSFPLLDQAPLLAKLDAGRSIVDVSAFDVEKITHFAISVFWRGDVAQITPLVCLGAHRHPIRKYLLGDSLPDNVNVVATLLKPAPGTPRVDRMMSFPVSSDDGTRHEFFVSGIRFTLLTPGTAPCPAATASLPRAKRALVSDARELISDIAEESQTSTAHGKLAKV